MIYTLVLSAFLSFILIPFRSSASDDIWLPESTTSVNFGSSESLLNKISKNKNISADQINLISQTLSKVKTTSLNINDSFCAGEFISDDGYMITALHCLSVNNSLDPIPFLNPSVSTLGKGVIKFSDPTFIGKKIIIENPLINSPSAKIIFLGKGFLNTSVNKPIEKEISDFIRENMEDFAILKLDSIPPGYACSKLRKTPMTNGMLSIHTGFPKLSPPSIPRINQLQHLSSMTVQSSHAQEFKELTEKLIQLLAETSDEKWAIETTYPLYESIGRAYMNYKAAQLAFPFFSRLSIIKFLDQISDQEIYAVSTAPAYNGFSGGGVFDINGDLAGINVVSTLNEIKESGYFPYGVSFLKSTYALKALTLKLGEQAVKKIFSCTQ